MVRAKRSRNALHPVCTFVLVGRGLPFFLRCILNAPCQCKAVMMPWTLHALGSSSPSPSSGVTLRACRREVVGKSRMSSFSL